jgi:hypothetical protein
MPSRSWVTGGGRVLYSGEAVSGYGVRRQSFWDKNELI